MRRLRNAPQPMRARIDAKGRITLPKPLRMALGLTPGATVLLKIDGEAFQAVLPATLLRQMRASRQSLQRRLAAVGKDET